MCPIRGLEGRTYLDGGQGRHSALTGVPPENSGEDLRRLVVPIASLRVLFVL